MRCLVVRDGCQRENSRISSVIYYYIGMYRFAIVTCSTHVKTHSLFLSVWHASTWLSWPAWTVLLTGFNMVELASLNSVVNRLEHGWAGQLERGCWQAWIWLSWPAWTVLLTGLNMVELASLNVVIDRLEHGWAGQLEQCCWKACSWMLEQTVHGLMNEQTWTALLQPSW